MPEKNYILLEEWIKPILKQMLLEQNTQVGLVFVLFYVLKAEYGSCYISPSVASETQLFFLKFYF